MTAMRNEMMRSIAEVGALPPAPVFGIPGRLVLLPSTSPGEYPPPPILGPASEMGPFPPPPELTPPLGVPPPPQFVTQPLPPPPQFSVQPPPPGVDGAVFTNVHTMSSPA